LGKISKFFQKFRKNNKEEKTSKLNCAEEKSNEGEVVFNNKYDESISYFHKIENFEIKPLKTNDTDENILEQINLTIFRTTETLKYNNKGLILIEFMNFFFMSFDILYQVLN
jgi:hypothetical protein